MELWTSEYLTDGAYPIGASANVLSPEEPEQADDVDMQEADEPEVFERVDLAEEALRHVQRNGVVIDRTCSETEADDRPDMELDGEEEDGFEETPEDRYRRYCDATHVRSATLSLGQRFIMGKLMGSTMIEWWHSVGRTNFDYEMQVLHSADVVKKLMRWQATGNQQTSLPVQLQESNPCRISFDGGWTWCAML